MSATKILWGQITVVFLIVLAHDLGRDGMDGVAARLPAPARPALVRACRHAGLLSAGLLLVVVRLRRLCARDLRRGRLHRRVRRLHLDRGGDRDVGLAGTGGEERHHLWLGALGRDRARCRQPGFSAPDGVVLGRLGHDYLRHDGPEHVLCFAPTRSGKGVGLVVPTLLTWPGSAIVHDIKGENWQLTAGWRAQLRPRAAVRSDQRASRPPTIRCSRSAAANGRSATSRTSPTCWSIPKARSSKRNHWEKTSHSLLVGAILHVLYAEADKTLAGVANFLSDPKRPIETTLRAMMTTPHLGETGPHPVVASRRARAAQQVRERTLGRALDRDVLPRPLSRSGRRGGDPPLRLADRRPGRRPSVRPRSTSSCRPPTSAGPSR